jgi:CubicO group peptidase (beta-lactamase class C family)
MFFEFGRSKMILSRLFLTCVLMIFFLPFAFGEAIPSEHEIDTLAQKTLAEWDIPGLGLAVVHKGKQLRITGYGIKQRGC